MDKGESSVGKTLSHNCEGNTLNPQNPQSQKW